MSTTQIVVLIVIVLVVVALLALAVRIVKQYERGVVLRFGRLHGVREPGLRLIIPFVDVMHRVSLRIVTMPIQSQGIITRDNVSVGISAVAYYHVVDPVKSVIAIENVLAAIDQIAQTTLRKVVGQHTLDETLAETDRINMDIRRILDITTLEWGVEVTLVELKDIQLPDSMKRAMARQAEAEREKRAKIINAEGESLAAAALGDGVGHDGRPPAGAPAAQPAEPGRDRGGQEHHRGVPVTDHDHDRGAQVVHRRRVRGRSRGPFGTGRSRKADRGGALKHGLRRRLERRRAPSPGLVTRCAPTLDARGTSR